MKFYTSLQGEFFGKFTEAYKAMLKKDTQKEFLAWNYKLLLSNIGKMKLGARLYNADNSMLSHDGTLINVYSCFLNLCKVIASRTDDKYKSIDRGQVLVGSSHRTGALAHECHDLCGFGENDAPEW